MLHVSDLVHAEKCEAYAWNCAHRKLPFQSYYHMDVPFSALWKQYLGYQTYGEGHVGQTNSDTLSLLKKYDVVYQARFEYRGLRTKIPVLIRKDQGWLALYPHLSAYPKEEEARFMKLNDQAAASIGVTICDHEILYLNKDYVRQDELDLSQCFLRSKQLFNHRNHLNKTIQECIDETELDLDEWIDKTKPILEGERPEIKRTKACTSGRRCVYYSYCFDESKEPDDSVLFLTTSQYKLDAYEKGIRHIKDMPIDQLEGFRLQYSQYMASRNGGQFADRNAIQSWLSHIQYPISYLDFEWDTFAIPPYRGMRPFDVLCFQYSLHIEEKDKPLRHEDFFESGDCREAFVKSLIEKIPASGTILVYNMEGAEKLRLTQLAEQFPQYAEKLKTICGRMVDLSKPFEAGLLYDNRMRGHYSLKSILPVFSDQYSYQELPVSDGMDAVQAYREFANADPEKQTKIREAIRTYCSLDTLAEYIVYHGLLDLNKEEN
ncbi:DUF2779 domain-containing protein [Catenisphaera adipataccumulans]|jgi:hypothetical protein|uniref:DUF2779 domain-containing protein n=1 Tax=Catenisphaera adipataccumulans TaxID=700500 RepID=A0A7W8CXD1_9FIRM|nr:DUF2779 domain-containing protein [Catenisphaera adipataccumulans]MBB5183343.1 hypothetical protein [Catenisphaera adipataccumulans]